MGLALQKIAKSKDKDRFTEEFGYMPSQKAAVRALGGGNSENNGYVQIKDKEALKRTYLEALKNGVGGAGIGGAAGAAIAAIAAKGGNKKDAAKIGAAIGAILGGNTGAAHGFRKGDLKTLRDRGIAQSYFGFKTKMTPEAARKYLSSKKDWIAAQRLTPRSIRLPFHQEVPCQ